MTPYRLTDERLDALEALAKSAGGIGAEAALALIAELRALRKRVGEWEDRYSSLLRQYEALLRGATMWRRVRGE